MNEMLSIEHHRIHTRLAKQNKKLQARVNELETKVAKLKQLEQDIGYLRNFAFAANRFLSKFFADELNNHFHSVEQWSYDLDHSKERERVREEMIAALEQDGYRVTADDQKRRLI